jgi:polyferredoxin
MLARIVSGGHIENVYRLQVMNATETDQRFYIGVSGLPGVVVASDADVAIEATQSRWVAVRVQAPYDAAPAGSHAIVFEVSAQGMAAQVFEKSVFIVPR